MTENSVNTSVVVGIDGSKAALREAIWAAHQALDRDSTLRLLHLSTPVTAIKKRRWPRPGTCSPRQPQPSPRPSSRSR